MGFLSSILGLQDVLSLTVAGSPGEYWVDYRHVIPVPPSDVPRTLVSTVGLAYGQLHFSVYGMPSAHNGLFAEADGIANALSSSSHGPRNVLRQGDRLLSQSPAVPLARWSATILNRRRDGALFVKSSMVKAGEEPLAIDYLRFAVARVLPELPAQQHADIASILRGMNAYYRQTNDVTDPQSPSRAFYAALLSTDAEEQMRGREPSAPPLRREPPSVNSRRHEERAAEPDRRWCPRCGLGWTPKHFPADAEICIGCQQRQAEADATAGIEDWAVQRLAGGIRDTVDGAVGRFGYESTNPIPAFEEPGEEYYCCCLRCPQGHPFWFRRLGSVGISPDGHVVDVFELLCFGHDTHLNLYFDFYHRYGTAHVPEGLTLANAAGRGSASAVLGDFPASANGCEPVVPDAPWHRWDRRPPTP